MARERAFDVGGRTILYERISAPSLLDTDI